MAPTSRVLGLWLALVVRAAAWGDNKKPNILFIGLVAWFIPQRCPVV